MKVIAIKRKRQDHKGSRCHLDEYQTVPSRPAGLYSEPDPTLVEGMARGLDLFGIMPSSAADFSSAMKGYEEISQADWDALRGDWESLNKDFIRAIERVRVEWNIGR